MTTPQPSPQAQDLEQVTRQNMKTSRVIVFLAFLVNAGLNFVLLGVLSRLGGLELVGQWSVFIGVLLTILLADFGITNALVYEIGRVGVSAVLPQLRRLLLGLALMSLVLMLGVAVTILEGATWSRALAMTGLAGIAQLASNWMIALRMGQHEQYWFNVKTIVRVLVQFILALALYDLWPEAPTQAFGLALLLAGAAEMLFAVALTRAHQLGGTMSTWTEALTLTRGFGLLSVAQKGMDPLSRLLVLGTIGPVALGVFTVSRRLPVMVNQAVSEALRALLPGLAGMRRAKDRARVVALMREAVMGQILMVAQPMIATMIHAVLLFNVWLGTFDPRLPISLHVFTLGLLLNTVTVPFFWMVQAFGDAPRLAKLTGLRVGITLGLGSVWLLTGGGIVGYVLIFALSQTSAGVQSIAIAQTHDRLASQVFQGLPLGRIIAQLGGCLILNLGLDWGLADVAPHLAVGIIVLCNIVLLGPSTLYSLRRSRP